MENLIVELIRAIRGDKSQNALSLALGFEDNRVNRWEKKQRPIYWDDFVSLCEKQNIDLSVVLKDYLDFEGPADSISLVNYLVAPLSQKDFQHKIKVTAQTIGRWKAGKSQPTLDNILDITDSTWNVGIEMLHKICVMIDRMPPEIKSAYEKKRAYKRLSFDFPESMGIKCALDLSDYYGHDCESDAHYLAKKLQSTPQRIQEVLDEMLIAGQIEKMDNGHFKTTKESDEQGVLMRASLKIQKTNLKYCMNKAYERIEKTDMKDDDFRMLIYASNKELKKEIKEKVEKFTIDIINHIQNYQSHSPPSKSADSIEILNLQGFLLDQLD